jgi:hypothetical protein
MGSGDPALPGKEPSRFPEYPQGNFRLDAVIATLAGFCGMLVQLGYPVIYALLVTLALAVGSALIVKILGEGSGDDPDVPQ